MFFRQHLPMTEARPHPMAVAAHFDLPRPVAQLRPLGEGLINDTYLLECEAGPGINHYVMQRVNQQVFTSASDVMTNMQRVLEFLSVALKTAGDQCSLIFPKLMLTHDGAYYHMDDAGEVWRIMTYIKHSSILSQLSNVHQARQLGSALAWFHRLTSSMDLSGMKDTLPGFHVTSAYLQAYRQLDKKQSLADSADFYFCESMIEAGSEYACLLEQLDLEPRVMHGDPKLNNFLFRQDSDEIMSLIDLDTVKPGLWHYDLGDCIRSSCNLSGEEQAGTGDLFHLEYFQNLISAYMGIMGQGFSDAEIDAIYNAVRILPFELGLRYFSDYLSGNAYFKVAHPRHNLDRAVRQFQMVQAIEAQEKSIRLLIDELAVKL